MRARALPWLVLSTALHVALALALRTPPPRPRLHPPRVDDVVELALLAPAAPPGTSPAPGASEAARAVPAARARRARTPPPPRAMRAGATSAAAAAAEAAPSGSPVAPEPALDRDEAAPRDAPSLGAEAVARDAPSLSPQAVARAAVDAEPRSDAGAAAPPTAEARLNRAIVAGVGSHLDTIPDPVLTPAPRGGYAYAGHGFDALIRPDGSVTLRDRFGSVVVPLVPFRTPDGRWHVPLGLGGSFRLFEWLDRKFGKNDPYRSERRWFLERTRPLREKLERDHYGEAPGRAPDP